MVILFLINISDDYKRYINISLSKYCEVIFSNRDDRKYLNFISEADIIIDYQLSKDDIYCCDKLKLFHLWGSGFDKVDIKTLNEKNIIIRNTSDAVKQSIAEYVLCCILSSERDFIEWSSRARVGSWNFNERQSLSYKSLDEINLGIMGLGNTGNFLSRYVKRFGVKTIGYANKMPEKNESFDSIYLENDWMKNLSKVDYLSIHLPLNNDTEYIISSKILNSLKEGCVLINSSRGKLINEYDLYNAIKDKHIKSAYLDTTEIEPITKDSPIYNLDRVYITPHYAGRTDKSIKMHIEIIINNIKFFLEGGYYNEI